MRLICLLALLAGPALAQDERIGLGGGLALTSLGTGFETSRDGTRTLVLETRAEFDPEPHGPLPATEFARMHRQVCENVVRGNAGAVEAGGATRFRLIQRYAPEGGEARVHANLFDLDGGACLPVPAAGGLPHIATLPGGRIVALRHVEAGDTPDELALTFETTTQSDARFSLSNQNIAFEACVVIAGPVIRQRAERYPHLAPRSVRIAFENHRPAAPPGRSVESYLFPVAGDGRCVSGLPADMEAELRDEFDP
ncbi:MAG: hypothetical protein ACU0BS_07205 [Hasllibacter sp.]